MATEKVYGFGIVGCGAIAPAHVAGIVANERAQLRAVCDIDESRARKTAHEQGCDWHRSFKDLLARDDIDIVNVLTWSGTHAEIGIQAAKAGKHVVCTKPIDIRLDRIDELIATCRANGVKLAATHQFRSYDSYLATKAAVDDGRLGRLFTANAFLPWFRAQAYYDSAEWRGTYALDGGGAMMNQSVHYADLLTWLGGPLTELTAYAATQNNDIEVEDLAVAACRFANGALGLILGSTCVYKGLSARMEVLGENGNIVLTGDKVTHWDIEGEGSPLSAGESDGDGTAFADPNLGVSGGIEAHVIQIGDVLAAIDEDREPEINGEEARRAVEVVLAMYQSARMHGPVAFPLET